MQPTSRETKISLDLLLRECMSRTGVPGISLATLRGGRIDSVVAVGSRGAHDALPVNADTVFEAASLTKPVVAYIAMRLVDAGSLDLDTPLQSLGGPYVPGNDPRAASITARHVLTHTCGLPNIVSADQPLAIHFTPGERFSYASSAWAWLQRAMEKVSGLGLQDLMHSHVFAPLGMTRSSVQWEDSFEANHAQGHDWDAVPVPKRRVAKAQASWSLLTTGTDYARFLQAVLAGTGLSEATHEQWLAPRVQPRQGGQAEDLTAEFPPDTDMAWTMGWGLEPAQQCLFHWGNSPGFRAYVLADRHSGDAVVWFANSAGGLRFAQELIQTALPGVHPSLAWMHIRRH